MAEAKTRKIHIDYSKRVNRSLGQGIILIWKNLPENDPHRYEMFKRTSLLFEKYKDGELGIILKSLNNYFNKYKTSEPIIYENNTVRIIRTKLLEKKDFIKDED